MGIVVFNGISSADFHIQVEHPPGYEFPEKDTNITHVPGRNGDVITDLGSYKNVNRSYQFAIGSYKEDYTRMANMISEWLHSGSGYCKLMDSYEPEYYRMASYSESGEMTNIYNHAAQITANFNCKPQRFLKAGDEAVTFTESANLFNPTGFTSLPIITVKGTGSGTITIGTTVVSISDLTNGIIIDSEIQDAYMNMVNKNNLIKLSGNKFPVLEPGLNAVAFTGGVTSVEVVPKWWTL